MAKKKVTPIDLVKQKEDELIKLTKESESSLNIARQYIDNLSAINGRIQTVLDEIDEYTRRLADTRGGLCATYNRNEKIASNLSQLFCFE